MADKKNIGEIRLTRVRLSFADIFSPGKQTNEDGTETERYGASFLMEKNTPETKAQLLRIKAVAEEVKKAKWGDNIPKLRPDKICLRDGDLEDWDGYENHWYLRANAPVNRPPKAVGRNPGVALVDDGTIYAGCYVNAIVRIWAQDNKHGKRLNASLEAVQFVEDGEAFGAKPVNPESAFDDLSTGEDNHGFDNEDNTIDSIL